MTKKKFLLLLLPFFLFRISADDYLRQDKRKTRNGDATFIYICQIDTYMMDESIDNDLKSKGYNFKYQVLDRTGGYIRMVIVYLKKYEDAQQLYVQAKKRAEDNDSDYSYEVTEFMCKNSEAIVKTKDGAYILRMTI